jgi:hypothetical protein
MGGFEPLRQRTPGQQLHDDIGHALVGLGGRLAVVVHVGDVRVPKLGGGPGLGSDSLARGGVGRLRTGENFDRDRPVEQLIVSLPDHGHAANPRCSVSRSGRRGPAPSASAQPPTRAAPTPSRCLETDSVRLVGRAVGRSHGFGGNGNRSLAPTLCWRSSVSTRTCSTETAAVDHHLDQLLEDVGRGAGGFSTEWTFRTGARHPAVPVAGRRPGTSAPSWIASFWIAATVPAQRHVSRQAPPGAARRTARRSQSPGFRSSSCS